VVYEGLNAMSPYLFEVGSNLVQNGPLKALIFCAEKLATP
jgi:hypothetical protein